MEGAAADLQGRPCTENAATAMHWRSPALAERLSNNKPRPEYSALRTVQQLFSEQPTVAPPADQSRIDFRLRRISTRPTLANRTCSLAWDQVPTYDDCEKKKKKRKKSVKDCFESLSTCWCRFLKSVRVRRRGQECVLSGAKLQPLLSSPSRVRRSRKEKRKRVAMSPGLGVELLPWTFPSLFFSFLLFGLICPLSGSARGR